MATALTQSVCPYKVIKHPNGISDCHILIVLSRLPLTMFEFGNMAIINTVSLVLIVFKFIPSYLSLP
jgi:hypothetical protein